MGQREEDEGAGSLGGPRENELSDATEERNSFNEQGVGHLGAEALGTHMWLSPRRLHMSSGWGASSWAVHSDRGLDGELLLMSRPAPW